MIKRLLIIGGSVLLAALVVGSLVIALTAQSAADHDRTVIAGLQSRLSTIQGQLSSENQKISDLQGKVSGLTVPSDPLAAYNQICSNPNVQNQATGATQTYWYPCTNNAQTIPLPGQ